MTDSRGNPGVNKLARVINDRIMEHMGDVDIPIEFGKIEKDFSLVTNSFPKNIPKGGYHVLRNVSGKDVPVEGGTQASAKLAAGSRVLVAWVGNSPVVLDVVVSSAEI